MLFPMRGLGAADFMPRMFVADMFGDAVVFLLLGSVGAAGLMLVLAPMPETRLPPRVAAPLTGINWKAPEPATPTN